MKAINEPVLEYTPNSDERINVQKEYDRMASTTIEIPLIIDGKEIFTEETGKCIQPHNHRNVLAKYHKAQEKFIRNREIKIDRFEKTIENYRRFDARNQLPKNPILFVLYQYN